LADLFDQPLEHYQPSRKRPPVDYKQLCIMAQHWALLLEMYLEDVVAGKKPSEIDIQICRHAFTKFCQFAQMEL